MVVLDTSLNTTNSNDYIETASDETAIYESLASFPTESGSVPIDTSCYANASDIPSSSSFSAQFSSAHDRVPRSESSPGPPSVERQRTGNQDEDVSQLHSAAAAPQSNTSSPVLQPLHYNSPELPTANPKPECGNQSAPAGLSRRKLELSGCFLNDVKPADGDIYDQLNG